MIEPSRFRKTRERMLTSPPQYQHIDVGGTTATSARSTDNNEIVRKPCECHAGHVLDLTSPAA